MSLVARHLEERGIPTVIVGSARDIVEHCGVPRFLFTDFPLGNPCGRPWDAQQQRAIVEQALDLLETATSPRTTVQSPLVWSSDASWRGRYGTVRPEDVEELRRMGVARREMQGRAKADGRVRID